MSKLTLYYRKTCPFCIKVLNFLNDQKKSLLLKEIGENSQYFQELSQIAGKTQVPCLLIDEKPLFESLDIIDWLKKNL